MYKIQVDKDGNHYARLDSGTAMGSFTITLPETMVRGLGAKWEDWLKVSFQNNKIVLEGRYEEGFKKLKPRKFKNEGWRWVESQ